jgi:WD40 repeat protein
MNPKSLVARFLPVMIIALFGLHAKCLSDEIALPLVRAVAFSPDSKLLAVATGMPKTPGGVTVWDFAKRRVWLHQAAKDGVSALAFSPDGQLLAFAGHDGLVHIMDVNSKEERSALKHAQPVRAVGFSADGDLLAAAGDDNSIRFWNHADQKETKAFDGPKKSIRCFALSPDGKMIVAGADDSGHVWNTANEQAKGSVSHDGQGLPAVLFAPNSKSFVTGGYDGRVIVWDAKEILPRFSLRGSGGVTSLAYCAKTELLAAGSWRNVHLRRLAFRDITPEDRKRVEELLIQLDADPIAEREAASDALMKVGLVAEPLLKKAAAESKSAEVRLRARKIRDKMLSNYDAVLKCDEADVDCVAISPDGKYVVGGGRNGFVYVWDIATRKQVDRLQPSGAK